MPKVPKGLGTDGFLLGQEYPCYINICYHDEVGEIDEAYQKINKCYKVKTSIYSIYLFLLTHKYASTNTTNAVIMTIAKER